MTVWLVRAKPSKILWWSIAALVFIGFLFLPNIAFWVKALAGGVIAAFILISSIWQAYRPSALLWFSIALQAVMAFSFPLLMALPLQTADEIGLSNAVKRARGWEAITEQIIDHAVEINASAILLDEREVWHAMDFYAGEDRPAPILAWRRNAYVKSFSEFQPLDESLDETVLVASYRSGFRPRMRADFEHFEMIGEVSVELGHRSNGCPLTRRFVLYRASNYAPLVRDQAWEERFEGQEEYAGPPCPAQ